MAELSIDFISRTKKLLFKDWDLFADALKSESPVSIRLNPAKADVKKVASFSSVLWNSDGMYLEKRPPRFTFDPLFHSGGLTMFRKHLPCLSVMF